MPSVFRFLAAIGLVAGLISGGLYVLAEYYQPEPRETKSSVPGVKVRK